MILERDMSAYSQELARLSSLSESSFAYIGLVNPGIISVVERLVGRLKNNDRDLTAAFWLKYLEGFDLMARELGDEIDSDDYRSLAEHAIFVQEYGEEIADKIQVDNELLNGQQVDVLETVLIMTKEQTTAFGPTYFELAERFIEQK